MNEFTNKRVHRDHTLCLQLAERNMNGPAIRADIVEAIIGQVGTFSDTHAGVPQQQEDVGGEIVTVEQLLLDSPILLGR